MLSPFDRALVVAFCSWSCCWLGNIVSHDTHDGNVVVARCLRNTHTHPSKAHEPKSVRGHAVRRGGTLCAHRDSDLRETVMQKIEMSPA